MNTDELVELHEVSTHLYILHRQSEIEKIFSANYLNELSLFGSEWDYHYACSIVAGCVSQIMNKNYIDISSSLTHFREFKFISPKIVVEYFSEPEKCGLFIAHLYLQQKILDNLLNLLDKSTGS